MSENKKSDKQDKKQAQFDNEKVEVNQEQAIDVDAHNQEASNLKQQLLQSQKECLQLKEEVEKINKDYIDKVAAKAKEAQELVKKKQEELEERFASEVDSKINNYIEKKFNPILDCINQLSKIINLDTPNPEVKNYLLGFKMILNLFDNALAEMNISCIDIKVGATFDEKYMAAFEVVDQENFASNTVVEVISPAYKFNDKVIKHALVKVQK